MTLQQAWHGKWRNVTGAVRDETEMSGYVARAVDRDGYQSFRIADDSTDGDEGAPMRPVHAFVPLPAEEMSEWLGLVKRQAGLGPVLDDEENAKLASLMTRMQGEIIGATDNWNTAQDMQRTHSVKGSNAVSNEIAYEDTSPQTQKRRMTTMLTYVPYQIAIGGAAFLLGVILMTVFALADESAKGTGRMIASAVLSVMGLTLACGSQFAATNHAISNLERQQTADDAGSHKERDA